MDVAHRWALVGLGAMTITLLAPRIELGSGTILRLGAETIKGAPEHQRNAQWQRELMLDRAFEVGEGGVLSVDVGDGDVEVRPGEADAVAVRVWAEARDMDWGREVFERMQFEVERETHGVSVRSRDPHIRSREWRGNRGVGITVEITIPHRFDLDIRTADGDVDIGNVDGTVDLRTSDGDIVLGALTGPEISIRTGDGDVGAELLAADRITVHTSDGDVDLAVEGPSARVETSDGDIRLDMLRQGDLDLRTGDGDITLNVDAALRADVELLGSDVQVDLPLQMVGRLGRRGARGKLNGGGPLILARTGDGTITIRESRLR